MDYRDFLQDLLSVKTPPCSSHAPTAVTALLGCGLVYCGADNALEMHYATMLDAARVEFQGSIGTFVRYFPHTRQWQAVAIVLSEHKIEVLAAPLYCRGPKLLCKDEELRLGRDDRGNTLFRVCTWIARKVFSRQNKNPFPLLHQHAHWRPDTKTCYTTPVTFHDTLRQLSMYVHSVARQTREFDHTVASIVDILHCVGLVYVGSVNETTSLDERTHVANALEVAKSQGCTHLWWIEDFTVFECDHYNVVARFVVETQPHYVKRRVRLVGNRTQLQDMASGKVSAAMSWDYDDVDMNVLNNWVASLLGLPPGGACPYMRQEILQRYALPTTPPLCVRPFLVHGQVGVLPACQNTDLPPRLSYSPDLFIEPAKIPTGAAPSSVQMVIHIKPWVDDCDLQLFLRVEGEEDNVYRILYTKDRQLYPEADQLRIYVHSANACSLNDDAFQLAVIRRTLAPCGAMVAECVFTSHHKAFRLYTDSKLCDYNVRITLYEYSAVTCPHVFPPTDIPVFSNTAADDASGVLQAIAKVQTQKKTMVPLIYAEYSNGQYAFQYYNGHALVSMYS